MSHAPYPADTARGTKRGGDWKERSKEDGRDEYAPVSKRSRVAVEPVEMDEDDSPVPASEPNPAWGPTYVMPPKKPKTRARMSVRWAPDDQLEQVKTFVTEEDMEVNTPRKHQTSHQSKATHRLLFI